MADGLLLSTGLRAGHWLAALPSLGSEAAPLLLPSALGLSRLPETLGERGHRQDEVWGSVTLRGPQTSCADIRGQGEGKVKKAGVVTKEPQVGMWCSGCKGDSAGPGGGARGLGTCLARAQGTARAALPPSAARPENHMD